MREGEKFPIRWKLILFTWLGIHIRLHPSFEPGQFPPSWYWSNYTKVRISINLRVDISKIKWNVWQTILPLYCYQASVAFNSGLNLVLVYSKLCRFSRHELFKSAAFGPNFGLKYGRTRHYYSNLKFILLDNRSFKTCNRVKRLLNLFLII